MTTRAVAEIREWERRRYAGGFGGLHDLADGEFTGAVEADDHVCFVVRGRVVGVFQHGEEEHVDGLRPASIEGFEDADGTAYEAPHAALPLLFAMQATGGEERGRYYSEDTPLAEVHDRLSGGFTGYVELSENVLSGDYYSVYHGGRAKHVAFIGQSERLLEDEEAFERACDEVGIYTVTAVDLDVVEIPEAEDRDTGTSTGAGGGAAGVASTPSADAADAADAGTTEAAESTPGEPDDASLDADIPDTTAPTGAAEGSTAAEAPSPRGENPEAPTEAVTSVDGSAGEDAQREDGAVTPEGTADDTDIEAAVTSAETAPPGVGADEEGADDGDEFEVAPDDGDEATGDGTATAAPVADAADPATADEGNDDVAALRSALAAREDEVERLEAEVDRLETALQEARDERDDLAARVEDLEGRLRELGAGDAAPETAMTPAEALAGTSLFVRYRSKGEPTLDDLAGGVSRESVVENLRLEHHTEFDEETVAVDGRQFGAFLEDTQEYRFARWLVTELPLEIRETGTQRSLGDLYQALPEIDRIEFDATLADDRTFDLVARNRMGEPLVVATLDDARDPTSDEEMADLVTGASAVSEESGTLAAAMAVTKAFFEPAALATAEDATGGSLLSRDKRESYVKLSRGRGFHLCLVEDREESFYISVPEL